MARPHFVHSRPNFKSFRTPELDRSINAYRAAKARMMALRQFFDENEDEEALAEAHADAIVDRNAAALKLCAESPLGVVAVADDLRDIISCIPDREVENLCLNLARHCYD